MDAANNRGVTQRVIFISVTQISMSVDLNQPNRVVIAFMQGACRGQAHCMLATDDNGYLAMIKCVTGQSFKAGKKCCAVLPLRCCRSMDTTETGFTQAIPGLQLVRSCEDGLRTTDCADTIADTLLQRRRNYVKKSILRPGIAHF